MLLEFYISIKKPFLAASPDSIVSCECCGEGCLEVKCPFSYKDKFITESLTDKNTCLNKTKNGEIQLDRNHSYYYQTQLQLFATQISYCNFYIRTTKDWYWERILLDETFLGITIPKSEIFFMDCILPELVGKFYTRAQQNENVSTVANDHTSPCFVIVNSQTLAP